MPLYISVCASCEACELHTPSNPPPPTPHRRHAATSGLAPGPPRSPFLFFFAHGNKRWQCWVILFETVQRNDVMSVQVAAAAPATMGYNLRIGILLPKLFLPTVRKNVYSDQEKLFKFEAKGWEFAKFLRSSEQFIQTVKGQKKFWQQNAFLTCSRRFLISNKLE